MGLFFSVWVHKISPPAAAPLVEATEANESGSSEEESNFINWESGVWEFKPISTAANTTETFQSNSFSWGGGLSACDCWHSVAIILRTTKLADISSGHNTASTGDYTGSVELAIDGSNRIRLDDVRPGTANSGSICSSGKGSDASLTAFRWFQALNPNGNTPGLYIFHSHLMSNLLLFYYCKLICNAT